MTYVHRPTSSAQWSVDSKRANMFDCFASPMHPSSFFDESFPRRPKESKMATISVTSDSSSYSELATLLVVTTLKWPGAWPKIGFGFLSPDFSTETKMLAPLLPDMRQAAT